MHTTPFVTSLRPNSRGLPATQKAEVRFPGNRTRDKHGSLAAMSSFPVRVTSGQNRSWDGLSLYSALASSVTTSSSMLAPAKRSASGVNSSGWWLMPPTLGTKIIADGAMRAIIRASCPAPDVIRLEARPRHAAVVSTNSTILLSKVTVSKRAIRSTEMVTCSCAATWSR